jgi:hypothetical protein
MNNDRLHVSNIKKLKVIYSLMTKINDLDKEAYGVEKWASLFGLDAKETQKLFDEMEKKEVGSK